MSCLGLDMAKFFHLWCFIVLWSVTRLISARLEQRSIPHLLYDHASGCVLYSFGDANRVGNRVSEWKFNVDYIAVRSRGRMLRGVGPCRHTRR